MPVLLGPEARENARFASRGGCGGHPDRTFAAGRPHPAVAGSCGDLHTRLSFSSIVVTASTKDVDDQILVGLPLFPRGHVLVDELAQRVGR